MSTTRYSGIGGQAVLEGIMMENQDVYSVGVRKPDGEIEVHLSTYEGIGNKRLKRLPIVRGVISFVDSLVLGMKCLTFSASFYDEEETQPSKADQLIDKLFGEKAEKVVMDLTVAFSIVMAVAIFMVLPYFAAALLRRVIVSDTRGRHSSVAFYRLYSANLPDEGYSAGVPVSRRGAQMHQLRGTRTGAQCGKCARQLQGA